MILYDADDLMRKMQKYKQPRLLLTFWIAGCIVLTGIIAAPINTGLLRLVVVIAFPFLWILAVYLLRPKKIYAAGLFAVGLMLIVFALLPGRTISPGRLRVEYTAQLKQYEGSRYIWGGENLWGIDCSGLIRRSLINAYLKLAFTTANPELLRSGLDLWWHDCTAKALRNSYRKYTITQFTASSISATDPDRLNAGDIAITADGIHVLAYLGNQQWIEADPSYGQVIIVSLPTDNPWFNVPINIMCWTGMSDHSNKPDASLAKE